MMRFKLSDNSGVPIYRQIQDQVRYGIASGLLRSGEQLPTVRALAVELAVNPNTVTKAYTELEREGIVTTEQGTGTFVNFPPTAQMPEAQRRGKLESLCMEFLAHAAAHGFSPREVVQTLRTINTTQKT